MIKMCSTKISLAFLAIALIFISCNDNNPLGNENGDDLSMIDEEIARLSSPLFNTTWKHSRTEHYNKQGNYSHTTYSPIDCSITFSDIVLGNTYLLKVNGEDWHPTYWYVDRNGLTYSASLYGYDIGLDDWTVGAWSVSGGFCGDAKILKRTKTQLVLKEMYSDGINYILHYLNSSSEHPGNNENAGATDYEKPEIGFYDFTATKTSLKVQYKIYNKDEAKVTSAKIYYGTSSNPTKSTTATVSGVMITANISGLKAGTEYYVKCVATGKGGTTTTTVTKCITNYDY